MSEEKSKIIPLQIVVEAGQLDSETGKLIELVAGLEKPLVEQLVREVSALQKKIEHLEKHLEELRSAKGVEEKEEDKGEQL